MPQVDLDALVSVCGGGNSDRKIVCETLADGQRHEPKESNGDDDDVYDDGDAEAVEVPPDFPPESFWLSKDAELDWFDRNAFLERKESTKGNSNSTNLNPQHSNSSSQRFSSGLKSKASILGLPKTQKNNYVDAKRRHCRPPNIRLFPKRSNSDSVGKSAVSVTEPSSPKVSCMGRVRSKKGRRRSSKAGKKAEMPAKTSAEKEKTASPKKTGIYFRFISIFRSGGNRADKPMAGCDESPIASPPTKSATVKLREAPVSIEPATEAPGLGAMKRFASGRKSDSWATEEVDVARNISLDSGRRAGNVMSGPSGRC